MNAVAQLKEYHDKYPMGKPPGYTHQPDATSRLFKATCSYRNKETTGIGSSKKDAQRAAADQMLRILNVTPKIPVTESVTRVSSQNAVNAACPSTAGGEVKKVLTEDEKQKAFRFLAEYSDKEPDSDSLKWMAPDQRIIEQADMGLKSDDMPKSDTLAYESQNADAIDTFKQVMKEMKLKFCCKVPEIKHDAKLMHIVLVQIYYRIYLVAGGTGFSVELATYAACQKAITMLKIYTK